MSLVRLGGLTLCVLCVACAAKPSKLQRLERENAVLTAQVVALQEKMETLEGRLSTATARPEPRGRVVLPRSSAKTTPRANARIKQADNNHTKAVHSAKTGGPAPVRQPQGKSTQEASSRSVTVLGQGSPTRTIVPAMPPQGKNAQAQDMSPRTGSGSGQGAPVRTTAPVMLLPPSGGQAGSVAPIPHLAPATPAQHSTVQETTSAVPTTEEGAYKEALALALAGRMSAAHEAFQRMRQQYPQGGHAADVQYWLAESLYRQGRYGEAVKEFSYMAETFSTHHKAADAQFKAGVCHARLGDSAAAGTAFRQVLMNFAQSEAAKIVRRRNLAHD